MFIATLIGAIFTILLAAAAFGFALGLVIAIVRYVREPRLFFVDIKKQLATRRINQYGR